jgi:hypothetical protein
MIRTLAICFFFLLSVFRFTDSGPEWKVLVSGKNSGCMEKKAVILHDEKEFVRAWMALRKTDFSLAEKPPKVNFREKLIIACFAGTQTNGLEADSLFVTKGCLTVCMSRLSIPAHCHNAALLVTPFVFIETDRVGWNVMKEQDRVRIRDCN